LNFIAGSSQLIILFLLIFILLPVPKPKWRSKIRKTYRWLEVASCWILGCHNRHWRTPCTLEAPVSDQLDLLRYEYNWHHKSCTKILWQGHTLLDSHSLFFGLGV